MALEKHDDKVCVPPKSCQAISCYRLFLFNPYCEPLFSKLANPTLERLKMSSPDDLGDHHLVVQDVFRVNRLLSSMPQGELDGLKSEFYRHWASLICIGATVSRLLFTEEMVSCCYFYDHPDLTYDLRNLSAGPIASAEVS